MKVGLQFKIIGTVFLTFLVLFSFFVYTHTQKYQQLLKDSYITEAKAIANALDANIRSRADLARDVLEANIYKHIWLNPNILKIDINLPQNDNQLMTFFSNDQSEINATSDVDNLQVLKEGILINKIIKIGDQRILQVITPIHLSGQNIGTYQIDFTLENVDRAMADEAKTMIIYYILIIMGFVLLLFIFSKNITRPLKDLMITARALAAGNLNQRAQIKSNDEVGQLAISFNQMVESLLMAEKYNENLIQAVPVSLVVLNSDMTIRSVNPSTLHLLGYAEKELVGVKINKIFVEGETVRKGRVFKGEEFVNLIEKGFIKDLEMLYQTSQKEEIPVGVSASVIKDETGKILNIVVAAKDMRVYKELEQQKLEAEKIKREETEKYVAKLETLDKLKDDFLNITTHELRTPLTSILVMIEILKEKTRNLGDPEMTSQVGVVFSEAQRLKKIADQILTATRFENEKGLAKSKIFDLAAVVKSHLPVFESLVNSKYQKIKFNIPPIPVLVNADPDQILEVLINFVDNAAKYGSKKQTIKVNMIVAEDKVRVEARNQGNEIESEKINQIFYKFSQMEKVFLRQHEGLGLGLYICRLIIESYHGQIGAESIPREGSVFHFTLPIAKGK
ncbi:hypothetical protein COX68_03280 [Candidatus Falkowbacteria bacterium CG_4_10_14_0_2_um_filter_41_15]|uniref:histidine kinase n=2 Tax=Candidatus Falkowiibacteriota TaxID=1752728 RepID=A0A2G9ZP56_9BACT|nr:MAG: hypothetical protein COX21_00040 [Candidatus Falkowbacteria bacterium CG23_combo_of_CG06-09_8_20_14_all_41_10]PJA09149.1 MAG: hypothetical protein COX68_03280 [Candidatus Falkowbacteria bacterium CG_4_10_14_0_2_um_filter_41_15]